MDGDWSNLLPDLLALILSRLPLRDRIRFGAVCTSWRLAMAHHRPATPDSPWLLILSNENDDDDYNSNDKDDREFFSLGDWRPYTLHLPQIRGHYIMDSSNGWIFTKDSSNIVYILNPLTGVQITLPSLAGTENPYHMVAFFPTLSLAVICINSGWTTKSTLKYARIGDDSWTTLPTQERITSLYTHKDRLYATTRPDQSTTWSSALSNQRLLQVEFGRDEHGQLQPELTRFYGPRASQPWPITKMVQTLMPDGGGDDDRPLWLWEHFSADGDHKTCRFTVFRLEDTTHEWTEVKSLGDRAIATSYIGKYVCFSTLWVTPEMIRGNSIYFILDWEPILYDSTLENTDTHFFNMDDGSINKAPFKVKSNRAKMKRLWIAPTVNHTKN